MTSRCGSRTSASPRTRSGATDHSSSSSRTSVSAGLSPTSTAPPAPSAQRPGPRRQPRRAPAGEPAPVGVAHDAERRDRLRRRRPRRAAAPSAAAAARAAGAVARVRVADEPRGEAVVARRAAVAQRVDRGVGRGRVLARRLEGLVAPVGVDRVDVPGAAGEEGGRVGHAYILRPHDAQAPDVVGVGLRGRAAGRLRAGGRGARHARLRPRSSRSRRARGRGAARHRGSRRRTAASARDRITARAGEVLPGRRARVPRALRPPARRRRVRATERDVEAVLEWAAGANVAVIPYGGGTSVVGGVEGRVPESFDGVRVARPGAAGPRARGRPRLARGAHPGRRERPAPGGAARRARDDAALLPAVVRALDARRLDRHARGRALRDGRDAHRRPRRVGARDHAGRASGSRGGCRARAPGRRPTGCCSAARGPSA